MIEVIILFSKETNSDRTGCHNQVAKVDISLLIEVPTVAVHCDVELNSVATAVTGSNSDKTAGTTKFNLTTFFLAARPKSSFL